MLKKVNCIQYIFVVILSFFFVMPQSVFADGKEDTWADHEKIVTCKYQSPDLSSSFDFSLVKGKKGENPYIISDGHILSYENESVGEYITMNNKAFADEMAAKEKEDMCPNYVVVLKNVNCYGFGLFLCNDYWGADLAYTEKEANEIFAKYRSGTMKKTAAILSSTNNSELSAGKKPDEENPLLSGENIENNCEGVLGPNVLEFLQQIFNYIKILGPVLVILFSMIDFTRSVLSSDEENMKKTQKKFGIRLVCAVGLYFLPLIVNLLINLVFGTSGDQSCGLK